MKSLLDKRERPWKFMVGDSVLLRDKQRAPKGMHKKIDTMWKGPFTIHHSFEKNSFKLAYPDGKLLPLTYNGKDLKLHQISK